MMQHPDATSTLVANLKANGRLRTHGAPIQVISPVTGAVIGEVSAATRQDVIVAVTRARAAQPAWAALPYRERARVMMRFHDRLLAAPDAVLDVIQAEAGKSRWDAFAEVGMVATTIRYYANHGARHLRARRRRGAYPLFTAAWLVFKPLGVVGLICPWNFPFILTIAEAAPALLAGNAVVIKPASLTPLSALWGAAALAEAGLPPDVLQIVPGSGREAGDALIDQVDFLGFTGSTEVGRAVAARVAARLIPYSMELGGKNAMIVLEDADIEAATDNLLDGAFANCGQQCIAIERVYVMATIYDAFLERLAAKTRALRLGSAKDYDHHVGCLITAGQLETVEAHVQDAVARGARVVAGGRRRPDLGPLFYEPTVLTGVTPAMRVFGEETFGPVVSVYRVASVGEALAAVNDSEYGLNASVWTRDLARGRAVAACIETGTACVNEVLLAYPTVDAPMGGVKASGVSRRHGEVGIRKFTEMQTIAVSRRPLPLIGPPALGIKAWQVRLLRWFLRLWPRIPFIR
ncbi:MAG: succinic semialdehyde dehydrogenase [Anaerolineae bacterium]